MVRLIFRKMILATVLSIPLFAVTEPSFAASPPPPVNGVSLEYLNGFFRSMEWVLDNQCPSCTDSSVLDADGNPVLVRSEISNLLGQYKAAGVNYIRLFAAKSFYDTYCGAANRANNTGSYCYGYDPTWTATCSDPALPGTIVNCHVLGAMQVFINLINTDYPGQFKVELLISGVKDDSILTTAAQKEAYIADWVDNIVLNPANSGYMGLTMLGVGLSVCDHTGCDGDPGADAIPVQDDGEFIKTIWSWATTRYGTSLYWSYETVSQEPSGGQCSIGGTPVSGGMFMQCIANWANNNTPGLPYLGTSVYITESPGNTPADYANGAGQVLESYYSIATTPLWIDEFGGQTQSPFSDQTQQNSISGILLASRCHADLGLGSATVLWITGNDYDPNAAPTFPQFGVVSGFDQNAMPVMRQAWSTLSGSYNYSTRFGDTGSRFQVASHSSTTGILTTCSLTGNVSSFAIVTNPSHGTLTLTNAGTGAYTYTPSGSYVGTDTFSFQVTFSDGWVSPAVTGSVLIYPPISPAQMTELTNYQIL